MPVLGWQHDWFPAFYTRSSGLEAPHRVESADEVAHVHASSTRPSSGVLLAVPIPKDAELDPGELAAALDQALADGDAAGITGAAITPFVLGRIAEATDGRSIPANLALAENNARVAAQVAVAIADWAAMSETPVSGDLPHRRRGAHGLIGLYCTRVRGSSLARGGLSGSALGRSVGEGVERSALVGDGAQERRQLPVTTAERVVVAGDLVGDLGEPDRVGPEPRCTAVHEPTRSR